MGYILGERDSTCRPLIASPPMRSEGRAVPRAAQWVGRPCRYPPCSPRPLTILICENRPTYRPRTAKGTFCAWNPASRARPAWQKEADRIDIGADGAPQIHEGRKIGAGTIATNQRAR